MNFRLYSLVSVLSLTVISLGAMPSTAEAKLRCQDVPKLIGAYLSHHVTTKRLDDRIRTRTVENFVKRTDPSKTLFLEKDANRVRREIKSLFNTMGSGNCKALTQLHQELINRTKTMAEFVAKFVEDPKYKLDESVELTIDPEKRGYPRTTYAQEKLYEKLIHFQISNYLSTGSDLKEAKRLLSHRYELFVKRAEEKNPVEHVYNFLDAFASALDPHSSYFSPDALEDFRINMGLSLEGIGVSLSSDDGYTVVEEIIPGGATDKRNDKKPETALKPKDKIIAVGQDGEQPVNIIDMALKDVVKLIRGKKNTSVNLTILRQSEKTKRFQVTIVRDEIDLAQQAAKIRYETREVNGKKYTLGVLDIPSFYGDNDPTKRTVHKDVAQLLEEAKKKKVDGILMDLSRNGGGLLDASVHIAGFFIKKGGIVATRESRRNFKVLDDTDASIEYSGPLAVLTSRRSASASEIVAGALKDYDRALIIGDSHTFGKGTVQQVMPLPLGLGAVKVTTGMFFLPGGQSTQHMGVVSDVVIPSLYNTDDIGEKALDYSLPTQKTREFLSANANEKTESPLHWQPLNRKFVPILEKRSKLRVSKNEAFKDIVEKLAKSEKNEGVIKLADVRKEQAEAQKEEEKAEKENKSREERIREAEAPQYNEALNILADYVALTEAPNPVVAFTEDAKKTAADTTNQPKGVSN